MNFVIPNEILSKAHLSVADVKQEIALLFWQKNYVTQEQASTLAEISLSDFQQQLLAKNTGENLHQNEEKQTLGTEHACSLMKEEKMIVLSHQEWERFIALQEKPPKPNDKLKQLMQRKSLIK